MDAIGRSCTSDVNTLYHHTHVGTAGTTTDPPASVAGLLWKKKPTVARAILSPRRRPSEARPVHNDVLIDTADAVLPCVSHRTGLSEATSRTTLYHSEF
jgi:hypothetical protein